MGRFINQEWWGCESLDLEDYKIPKFNSDYIILPIEFITQTVDKKYINEISRKNRFIIDDLKKSISQFGQLEPGLLVTDSVRIKLQNGNHRFIVCSELNIPTFKVKIEHSSGQIKSGGIKYQDIFEFLLRGTFNV